jgi:PKD repeat protein
MRWPDGCIWNDPNHPDGLVLHSTETTYAQYGHKKVLITAPATGKSLIASIEESGPGINQYGTVAGAPPDVFVALGLYPRGDGWREPTKYTLNYEWADQNSQLGPCIPDSIFYVYIDPAGYTYDVDTLGRISGANVWLQRSDGQGGWENVPIEQVPSIMQPDVNPLTTNTNGQYQWDVLDGTYQVHVEASNYYPADSIVVNIPPPVSDLNIGLHRIPGTDEPPVADVSGPTSGFVGETLFFDGSASHDPYGTIVSHQWTFGDGDSAEGAYVTHIYTTPENYEARLTVTDNGGLLDSEVIRLTISPLPNQPPILDSPGDQVISEGKTLTLNLQGNDPDNDPVTYSFVSNKPINGATLVGQTFTWTPGSGTAGTYLVTFKATDSGDLSDEEIITITVILPVKIDIKPGSCPNGFNRYEKGVTPVAIAGTFEFDVKTIDPTTITLNGVKASKWVYADTTTPYLGTTTCDCHTLAGDGIMDLMVYFPSTDVSSTILSSKIKDIINLNLSGLLKDGRTSIDGNDCVKIAK